MCVGERGKERGKGVEKMGKRRGGRKKKGIASERKDGEGKNSRYSLKGTATYRLEGEGESKKGRENESRFREKGEKVSPKEVEKKQERMGGKVKEGSQLRVPDYY